MSFSAVRVSVLFLGLLLASPAIAQPPSPARQSQWYSDTVASTPVSSVKGRNGILTLSIGCRNGAHVLMLSLPPTVAIQTGIAELTWGDGSRNFHRIRRSGGSLVGLSNLSSVSELVTKILQYRTVRIRALDEIFEVIDQFDLAGSSGEIDRLAC